VYVTGQGGSVYAINAETGARIWKTMPDHVLYSAPAVGGGAVFVGGNNGFYALDAATGTRIWHIPAGVVFGPAALAGGIVFFTSESNEGILFAMDAVTGEHLWQFHVGSAGGSSPAVANGVVYESAHSRLHALDAATGRELWRGPAITGMFDPVVTNGFVYAGSIDGIVAAYHLPS
jgi:outer membrane protein assembly factor BamB